MVHWVVAVVDNRGSCMPWETILSQDSDEVYVPDARIQTMFVQLVKAGEAFGPFGLPFPGPPPPAPPLPAQGRDFSCFFARASLGILGPSAGSGSDPCPEALLVDSVPLSPPCRMQRLPQSELAAVRAWFPAGDFCQRCFKCFLQRG